jgi:hypothetical protein
MHGHFRGSGEAGKGSAGRSTVAGDQVAAGTPVAGQRPWFLAPVRSSVCGGVRSMPEGALYTRARAGDTGTDQSGAGRAGSGAGVLWRASNMWKCSSARVQQLAEIASVRILAQIWRRPLLGT